MIRIKKVEAAKKEEASNATEITNSKADLVETAKGEGENASLSVLGIGGKQLKNGAVKKIGIKKRTPGEIRIQKGI